MQKVYQQKPHSTEYFPVQTYLSLQEHLTNIQFKENELHVFGTTGVTKSVKRLSRINTASITEISRRLFGSFRSAKLSIYLQAVARELINNGHFEHHDYLLNRLAPIVESYYVFAELGLPHLHYRFGDTRKDEVMEVINHLLKNPVTENYFGQKEQLNRNEISLKLVNHSGLDTIIFYEIDYMNFGRMSFIHWLKEKGFNVEFRVPYESNLPEVHKYWDSVYRVVTKANLPAISHTANTRTSGKRFGNFYENQPLEENDDVQLSIMEFETPYDFSRFVEDSSDTLLAVDPEVIHPALEHQKSSVYENRIGKFIYYIQFVRLEDDELYVDYDTLVELVTSAFINTKTAAGTEALAILTDLEEYLSGTETIGEIKERLQSLGELELVSRTFDRENAEDLGRNRMKRYMLNPFKSFSYLNQDRYDVTIHQLIDLVDVLEKTLKFLLLGENSTMEVNEYFGRWQVFIEELEESEQKAFWWDIFNMTYPEDWKFSIHELLQLIYLEAASRVKEKKIRSLASIQEVILHPNHEALHITNLTQMNFPERHHVELSQFFTHTDIKNCVQAHTVDHRKFLYYLLVDYTVSDSFEELGVYRLYQVLSQYKGKITLSWIKNLEKNSFRNIYLDILADLYTDGKVDAYEATSSEWMPEETPREYPEPITPENIQGKIPDLYWLDHDFCSKKFFLTTFIDQQPIYESEFHHRFLFSKIGKLFSYSREERGNFRKYMYPLFPHWTYTMKENLIDMEYKTELRKYKSFENISYPREMKSLQILRSVHRENRRTKARNQYRKDKAFNDKKLIKQFSENVNTFHVTAEPGNHCKMCPHLNSCTEGMYAIDNLNQ